MIEGLRNRYYQGPASDHFDGSLFFNPGLANDKRLAEILRWRLFGKRPHWPQSIPARSGLQPPARVDGLRITAIGHSSLLIQVANLNILVDPVWSRRASPFQWVGPFRRNPPAVAFEDLPRIDAVLITHNHYDHLDTLTIARLCREHHPLFVTPLGNGPIIHAAAPSARVETGDWWDTFTLSEKVQATIVPSYHWSSRSARDRRMALWGGFMLNTPAGAIYCAGDTAYHDGKIFREIGRRCGAPVVALLPIGAYAPRWFMQSQHIDPEEALQIAADCGARTVLGIHWGTFELTDEPYKEPVERLAAAARLHGPGENLVQALRPGDVWEINLTP